MIIDWYIISKIVVLYVGLFFTVIFGAIAIKLARMPGYEYNRERRRLLKKSLYLNIKNNKWTLK